MVVTTFEGLVNERVSDLCMKETTNIVVDVSVLFPFK